MIEELEYILDDQNNDPMIPCGESLMLIIDLIPKHTPACIFEDLPLDWRRAFVTWSTEAYSADIPLSEVASINNPRLHEQIAIMEGWLATASGVSAYVVNDPRELLQLHEARLLSRADVMRQLVRLSADRDVEDLLSSLPASCASRFRTWAAERFGAGTHPQRPGEREILKWLAGK